MADEILNRIEKHMEGTSLGLAALAEVLQKMDGRMEADDAYAIEKAEQEQAAIEHAALVKNIAKSVLIELSDQGMDVDGTGIENVGKPDPTKGATATPNYVGDSDDSSETVEPRSSIEDQQASIMAEDNGEEEDKDKKMENAMHPKVENAMKDDKDEDENGEMKKAEEEEEDEDKIEEAMGLKKQLANLQKQIEALDISKAVKEESENRLRKMGFKEENGLQRPQLSNSVWSRRNSNQESSDCERCSRPTNKLVLQRTQKNARVQETRTNRELARRNRKSLNLN